jgi:hypothetical protein
LPLPASDAEPPPEPEVAEPDFMLCAGFGAGTGATSASSTDSELLMSTASSYCWFSTT